MTMTLTEVNDFAMEKFAEHGLHAAGWVLRFNDDTTRAGYCRYSDKVISISKRYIRHSPAESVKDTILHEIAHALIDYGKPHCKQWRDKFIEIGGSGTTRSQAPAPTFTPKEGMRVVIHYPVNPKHHGRTGVITKVNRVNLEARMDDTNKCIIGKIGLFKPIDTMAQVG